MILNTFCEGAGKIFSTSPDSSVRAGCRKGRQVTQ